MLFCFLSSGEADFMIFCLCLHMASKNFSFMLSSAMNMADGTEDDDSLFGDDDLSDNDSLNLNDDKSPELETPNR